MFESIINFFKKIGKQDKDQGKSKDAAKERLHLVLMQDRANVSADFLDLMKQEIIEVIKKYIDVDENAIDVRLTNKANGDGTTGAPALYANIPIVSIKEEVRTGMARQKDSSTSKRKEENKKEETKEEQVTKNIEESSQKGEKNNKTEKETEKTKKITKKEESKKETVNDKQDKKEVKSEKEKKEIIENKQDDKIENQKEEEKAQPEKGETAQS